MSTLRKKWVKPTLLFIVFLVFLALPRIALTFFGSTYLVELFVQSMIYGILALSLNLLLGYMGFPSLGHGAYLGIGAYATAILIVKLHMGTLPASLLAILITTFAAALFGLFALRARGVYFLMITLALAMLVWGLAYRWVSLTAGDNGISGISRPQLGPWSLREITHYYYFVFAIFLVSLFIIHRIVRSPFGRSLVGIKESETRMRTLGYNVWLHQYICFIIAGFFGGVSGVLFIFYNGFISPPSLEVTPNMEILLMVALGGPGTVIGPFIGAIVIVFLKNFVSVYTERWLIFLGSIYILTILYAPKGILQAVDLARRFLIGRPTAEKKQEKEYGK